MTNKTNFYDIGFLDGLQEEYKAIVNEKMEEAANYIVKNQILDVRIVLVFPVIRRIWNHGGKYVEKDYSMEELFRRLEEYPVFIEKKFKGDFDREAETVTFVSESFRTKDAPGSIKNAPRYKDFESFIKDKKKNKRPKF